MELEPVIYGEIRRHDRAEEIARGLRESGVAAVVESLGAGVASQQTMSPQMVRRTTRSSVCGPAITASSWPGDNLMMHAAFRVARPGDVLVLTAGHAPGVQWGGQTSFAARGLGLAGAVVDGAARDVDAIDELGFPVWSIAVSPLGATKAGLGSVNAPVCCAGVLVQAGDFVVADGDGVVVVPLRACERVYKLALARVAREAQARARMREDRVLPGELNGIYGKLDESGVLVRQEPWQPAGEARGGASR